MIREWDKPPLHITQHKRLVPYSTHQNSAFSGTSFMLGTLCAMLKTR